jgi:hypothetical protein
MTQSDTSTSPLNPPMTPCEASVLEAKASVLSSAISRSRESIKKWQIALQSTPRTDQKWERLNAIMKMVDIMSEVPAILIIKARTNHSWMYEEIEDRLVDLKPIIEYIEPAILKAGDNGDMAPISFIWFIAMEL